jgi:preprotein translocase subunit SecB
MAADAPTDIAAPATPVQADARQIVLQKFYVKDVSVEVPLAPQVFSRPWQPQIDVNVGTEVHVLGDDQFHIVLTVTVTAKLENDVAFLVEIKQAGIFTVRGFSRETERAAVLAGYCPSMLFPFAREAVADFVQKAGFPQLLLQPINFEALFVEHVNRQRAAAGQPPLTTATAPASTH